MLQLCRHALALSFLAGACLLAGIRSAETVEPGPFTWRMLPLALPASIKVYEGFAAGPKGEPLRAWFAEIDYSDRSLSARPFLSEESSGREPTSTLARRHDAIVAINGGYFDVNSRPARTYSLVVQDGKMLRQNLSVIRRGGRRFHTTRSAFAIKHDRSFDLAWVFHHSGRLLDVAQPVTTILRREQTEPDLSHPQYLTQRPWLEVSQAIGGGPRLIQASHPRITFKEEVFFGSGFQSEVNYARAAIGWTRADKLILFVADGRQPSHSVGLTLTQLTKVLLELGCVEAMNLDGGGSATLVVNDRLLNNPSDGAERPVTSIFAVGPA